MKPYSTLYPSIFATLFFTVVASQAQTLTVTNDLALWLRADAGVTTNASGGVIQWDDQSTNANNAAQITDAAAPLLINGALSGRPVLRFDGLDDFLNVPDADSLSFTADMTTLFVVKIDDFDWFREIWGKTAGPNGNLPAPTDIYVPQGANFMRAFRGDGTFNNLTAVDSGPLRADTYLVLGLGVEGSTLTHYLNNQANGSGTVTLNTADGNTDLKIGTRQDGFTRLKGDIAELLIYSRALSTTERSNAFNYLQVKYGLTNLAPSVTLSSTPAGPNVNVGDTVRLDANPVDLDGTIARVEFLGNGAPVGTATVPPYSVNVTINSAGTVTFTARAVDNKDGVGISNPVSLTAGQTGPTLLPVTDGLQLWLDAGTGTSTGTGDALVQWADQSGNANNAAQLIESMAPILVAGALNGLPVARFDGVDDFMDVADSDGLSITGDISTFYVIRFTDFANFRAVWGKTAGTGGNQPAPNDLYALPAPTPGFPRFFRGNGVSGAQSVTGIRPYPVNDFIVAGVNVIGTSATHYFSGTANGSATITAATADGNTALKIGSRQDGVTRMKGEIAEVLIYNRGLSASERTAVQRYLAEKYALPGTFTALNASPAVAVTGPAGILHAPGTFTITANASDADGSIAGVQFFANGRLLTNDISSPFSASLVLDYGEPVTITAIATDNLGARTSTAFRLCVQGPGRPLGLVAYWPFDGDANAQFGGTNGVLVNNPVPADDRNFVPNGALSFNGALAQRVEVPRGGGLSGLPQGTISMWVKWTGPQDTGFGGNAGAVLGRQGDGVFSADILNLNNADPDLAIVQWRHNSAATVAINGGTVVGNDSWRHLAITFTGTGSSLYVDGFPDGTGSGGTLTANANTPLAIGAWTGGGDSYCTASIDDVAIWNRPLTADEIGSLARGERTPLTVLIQPDCLTIDNSSGGITLRWESGAVLESTSDATDAGSWQKVNVTSPYPVPPPGASQQFYRLRSRDLSE
jgi:hypothetical protein